MDMKQKLLLIILALAMPFSANAERFFSSLTAIDADDAPLVVVVDEEGKPDRVLSIDGSCSGGTVADPVDFACRSPDKFVYWASTGVDISLIEAKDTDYDPFKANSCNWKAGKRLYRCKLKKESNIPELPDDQEGYQYKVTLINGNVLDPTIIFN
jgi:hypothetical protein